MKVILIPVEINDGERIHSYYWDSDDFDIKELIEWIKEYDLELDEAVKEIIIE